MDLVIKDIIMIGGMITMTTKTGQTLQISSFVLFVSDAQHDVIEEQVKDNIQLIDIVRAYPIENEKFKYWVMQLDVMDYELTPEEMCQFVIKHFSFICLRQEHSNFILVPNQVAYQQAMTRMYGPQNKAIFLYDMLTIGDRYVACAGTEDDIDEYGTIKLKLQENGNIYYVALDKECVFLFRQDHLIQIVDTSNGTSVGIDLLEGLRYFDFIVAILQSKS